MFDNSGFPCSKLPFESDVPFLPTPVSAKLGVSASGVFFVLILPFPPLLPPLLPFELKKFLAIFIAAAPPATPTNPPSAPAVDAFSNPKNFLNSFSAGVMNASAIIANIGFLAANSTAELTNIVYIIKWNGCNSALNMYSLIHISNACAFPSFSLSIG